jgi:hypothetical protein
MYLAQEEKIVTGYFIFNSQNFYGYNWHILSKRFTLALQIDFNENKKNIV